MEVGKEATSERSILQRVYVVHGYNLAVRDAMYAFLESLDLEPIKEQDAVTWAGGGTPFAGQMIEAAFKHAQAIIVLFTGDYQVRLREELRESHAADFLLQPTLDQIFEAGYAFGHSPDRTILIQVGNVHLFSDIDGRYIPNFTGRIDERRNLINRLRNAGCIVNDSTSAWRSAGNFSKRQGKPKK